MKNKLLASGMNLLTSDTSNVTNLIYKNRIKLKYNMEEMCVFNHNIDYKIDDLKDVGEGALLLSEHITKGKRIALVTDYDADGLTSAVVLTKGLLKIFKCNPDNVIVFINKRNDGNGFNPTLTNRIITEHKKQFIDLVISADHGSADEASYIKLKEAGIPKLLITDHHAIELGIPEHADVFINPIREDSNYIKSISGCCTAFLLLVKTYNLMHKTTDYRPMYELLPYVGMSTVTDVMTLDEPFNRQMVRLGLRELNSLRNKAWIPIKKILGVTGLATVKDFGWKFGPLINSGNAMDAEQSVYEMLMEEDPTKVDEMVKEVNDSNTVRKKVTRTLNKLAAEEIDTEYGLTAIVETNINVNGKVAAAVGGQYNRPIVCFSLDKSNLSYSGSGRGVIPNLDIMSIMYAVQNEDASVINYFGGHKGVLGCNIPKDKYPDFKRLFDKHARFELERLGNNDLVNIDMYVPENDITIGLANEVTALQPYGKNWLEPIFATELKVKAIWKIMNFVKIIFSRKNGSDLTATYFFNDRTTLTPDNIKDRLRGKKVMVAYTLKLGSYRGIFNLDLEVMKIGGYNE